MALFDLKNGNIILNPDSLALPGFREIWKKDKTKGKDKANKTHYKVGKKVRQTIEELGGTMPENLPTPDKSIKQLKNDKKKLEE